MPLSQSSPSIDSAIRAIRRRRAGSRIASRISRRKYGAFGGSKIKKATKWGYRKGVGGINKIAAGYQFVSPKAAAVANYLAGKAAAGYGYISPKIAAGYQYVSPKAAAVANYLGRVAKSKARGLAGRAVSRAKRFHKSMMS